MRCVSIPTTRGSQMHARSAGRTVVAALLLLAACGGGGNGGGGGGNGLAVGSVHACALRSGAVRCWGDNFYGQLGDGTTTDRPEAVRVRGLSGARAIAVGRFHTCAIVSDGVECWGGNGDSMKLGNAAFTEAHSPTPIRVDGLSGGVQSLALGASHSCALVDGGVKCWGDNTYAQLGTESGSESATPLQVPGLESGVEAIAAGDTYTCALANGGVRCWGEGTNGFLGDGSASVHTRATPYPTIEEESGVTALASSYGTTCALVGAQVQCWGSAGLGVSGTGCAGGYCSSPRPLITAPEGTTSLQLGLANLYLLVNGGLKAMGVDDLGQLGNGDPMAPSTELVDVSGLTGGVRYVSSRQASTCALLTSSQVRCWGLNADNQLGDTTNTDRSAPVEVQGL